VSDDIKRTFLAAIAGIEDEKQRAVLLLLFQLVERVSDDLHTIGQQLTVDVAVHAEDHRWVRSKIEEEKDSKAETRDVVRGFKRGLSERAGSLLVNLLCLAVGGAAALKLLGGG
jgi:hypothetical protein